MPEIEKLKVSANKSSNSGFDLPKDLEFDTGFNLFSLNINFLYALIALGVIILASFFLSTGSLEGQLNTDEELSSQIASDDALARFSDENIEDETSESQSSLPAPPSILTTNNTRSSADTQTEETESFVVENGILDITASNFEFDKTNIVVPVGQEITVNFSVLEGTHDFTINGIVNSDVLSAGDSETVTFTLENEGEINFFCSLHPQMIGTIVASSELDPEPSADQTDTTTEEVTTDTLEDDLDSILNDTEQDNSNIENETTDQSNQSDESFESTENSRINSSEARNNSNSSSRVVLGNSGPETNFLIALFVMIYFTVYKVNLNHE
jgi:plastocyanin